MEQAILVVAAAIVGCSKTVLQLELLRDLGIKEVKWISDLADRPHVTIPWLVLARKINLLQ